MSSAGGARRSATSATASSLAKRQSSSEKTGKMTSSSLASAGAKKRPALKNITNQRRVSGSLCSVKNSIPESSKIAPCTTKIVSIKKGSSANASLTQSTLPPSSYVKESKVNVLAPSSEKIGQSDEQSVSMDESLSTCDSLKRPELEYMDNNVVAEVDPINRKTSDAYIWENMEVAGNRCRRELLVEEPSDDKIVNVDDNDEDPQLCAAIACDIYKNLRASEASKRPAADFMERVQTEINAGMRAILVDWLVEVAEEYRLVPDTLYLSVNYIDRYLSGNVVDRQKLQLLGVACMLIASKYEEICAPQVEEFCYITDNTYFTQEVLRMESAVLNYLKFEMTAPTARCFLRRFTCAAQCVNEHPLRQLEYLASYIAELSLLEYSMLSFAPSLIAASSVFLANYILCPSKRPWNSTLQHYTLYQPSDLHDCVIALHGLCCSSHNSCLPAIREKYSQHKYKFVAKKYCPPSIPPQLFQSGSG